MVKPGKQFEKAVHRFIEANLRRATVYYDHHVADRDTGKLRQVDAWIEGHWDFLPVKILVSCKDRRRSLDVGFVEQFLGEVTSTTANFGVLFSSSGFSPAATEKSRQNGVLCASLYSGGPAPNVDSLLVQAYICMLECRFSVHVHSDTDSTLLNTRYKMMEDLALARLEVNGKNTVALSRLLDTWLEGEPDSNRTSSPTALPSDWSKTLLVSDADDYPEEPCKWYLQVQGKWTFYKAKLSANKLKGYRIHTTPDHKVAQEVSVVWPPSLDPEWIPISRKAAASHVGVYMLMKCWREREGLEREFTDFVKSTPLELL